MSFDIKRCVSLYSYQEEYYLGKMNLEDCIREGSKTGATGIELLPEQMIDEFPVITPEFKEKWFGYMEKYQVEPTCYDAFLENHIYKNRRCTLREQIQMIDEFPVITPEFKEKWFGYMEKYQVEPTCYDAFLENHIYKNRRCTLREQIQMMERDIKLAHELGFKTLRTLVSTPMEVIEGSLACASDQDIKICLEVHSPFSLNSGWADGYMEMILRTGTKNFGFMPDFGIFCKAVPDVLRDQARRKGVSEDVIKAVDDAFAQRVEKGFVKIKYDLNLGRANKEYRIANGEPELMEKVKKLGGDEAARRYAASTFAYSWCDPQDIIDNIKYIYHTHAKFYNTDESYRETSIPIGEVVKAYKEAGYHGYLSSEYEGNTALNDTFDVDSVEQVRRHQEALRRAIEEQVNI